MTVPPEILEAARTEFPCQCIDPVPGRCEDPSCRCGDLERALSAALDVAFRHPRVASVRPGDVLHVTNLGNLAGQAATDPDVVDVFARLNLRTVLWAGPAGPVV